MKNIITLSLNEFEKIISKRKSKVLLIILSIIIAGAGVLFYYGENILSLTVMEGNRFPVWILSLMMGFILPLFATMITVDSISGEYENGTMSNLYALPISRQSIYLSKLMGCVYYVVLMMGLALGISLLIAFIVDGFVVFSSLVGIVLTYLKAIIILGLIITSVGFVSLWCKSSSMTLVISILLYIGMNIMSIFMGQVGSILPTTIIRLYDKMLLPNYGFLAIYMICYYIILFIGGAIKFQEKEV
ncbi:ABC transporter permease [Oceanirhabdus sp. W0125-5]|uniref:ABC transporter permease n=1 Tax=Oceanirhabdus sp. W0125-5 TaxID=2999116 RepID=UPI0022F2C7E2|nr:ABC transporter permease subunit [Oceanirhabdus sp. W0125-5]WBW95602.1 ABC transporter permease subunit [Oceanirhabdus sp. W0125-5]